MFSRSQNGGGKYFWLIPLCGLVPAIAAGIARSAANPDTSVHAWNVLIDNNGVAKRVAVDDATGQIIGDPQALAGWPR